MENKYFKEALASMASEAAYGGAVRHMYDKGYSISDIRKRLDYSVPVQKIEEVIRDYEAKKTAFGPKYEYVQRVDELGRRSFIKAYKKE